jgi:hypothetical protein
MPRKSAEALAAEKWLSGPKHPPPRPGMGPRAQRLWREIVRSRPPEFFRPGAQSMLRTYCEVSVALEELGPRLAADNLEAINQVKALGGLQALLAQKLRISVLNEMRIDKAVVAERKGHWFGDHPLLGGKAGPKKPWEEDD